MGGVWHFLINGLLVFAWRYYGPCSERLLPPKLSTILIKDCVVILRNVCRKSIYSAIGLSQSGFAQVLDFGKRFRGVFTEVQQQKIERLGGEISIFRD